MNAIEMALHSWRQQKLNYDTSIKKVIAQLSKPIKFVPSTQYDTKLEELKQYLRYNYTYEEDQAFNEIYVQNVANVTNMTLMELANKLANMIGGDVKFWQNKILDIASNSVYHTELSIWEVSKPFEKYTGLDPQFLLKLRKKRSLAKIYLNCLSAICKLIDKCKPFQEDLLKIDESFKKLKKAEERYYAYLEETEDAVTSKQTNVSLRGKNQAKSNLFLFLKPKEDKTNTLANYKFVFNKESDHKNQSKLLKGCQYEELDSIFSNLYLTTKSQRQSTYSEISEATFPQPIKECRQYGMEELRGQFASFLKKDKLDIESRSIDDQHTFIWNKDYYFTYWGYPIKYAHKMDFTKPFQTYETINYEANSEDEYDELNAEDLNSEDDDSSQESSSNANSFVVDDDEGDQNQEIDLVYHYKPNIGYERWSKKSQDLSQYEAIFPFSSELQPYVYEEVILDEQFSKKIEGKSKQEIIAMIQGEKKHVSKARIDELLRVNFQKSRKQNKIIYHQKSLLHPNSTINEEGDQEELCSDEQQTTLEIAENSMTTPSQQHSMTLRSKSRPKSTENRGSSRIRENSSKQETIHEQSVSGNK